MKKILIDRKDTAASLSASLLSFALAILSFSGIILTSWWHYILAIILLIIVYSIFYVFIQFLPYIIIQLKPASVEANIDEELKRLIELTSDLYAKYCIYNTAMSEYQKVQIFELESLLKFAKNKISFMDEIRTNEILRNKKEFSDKDKEEQFNRCKEFVYYIDKELNILT